jgi:hypothetical protein
MAQSFVAHRLTGRRATTYNFADNDDGAGNFNTAATASGVPTSASNFTCAVPMRGTPNYNPDDPLVLGDIILLERGGRTVLVVATDVGGMPHPGSTVDLFKGVTTQAIGGDEGRNLNVMRIGNVSRNPAQLRAAIDLVGRINRGGEDAEAARVQLQELFVRQASNFDLASYVANPANRSTLLAQAPEQGPPASGTGGHRSRPPESTGEYKQAKRACKPHHLFWMKQHY